MQIAPLVHGVAGHAPLLVTPTLVVDCDMSMTKMTHEDDDNNKFVSANVYMYMEFVLTDVGGLLPMSHAIVRVHVEKLATGSLRNAF